MPANVHPYPFLIQPPADLLTRYPHLRHTSHALALRYVYGPLVTEDDLQAMGTALWDALDLADAFEAARAEANPAILPLIIESDAPDIQLLPWETLYHPDFGFIGKSPAFTLSRRTGTEKLPATPPEPGPLRVLLFTSLPNDVDPEKGRLNVEEEQAQVLEALAPWEAEGTVVLEMPNDGRFSTLQETLKTFKPHLVFLSGHGKFHHEPHQTEPPYGIFHFEDEAGDGDPVRDERLARAFIGMGVQAVVLSACESGKGASTDLMHGLAAQLRGLGIPHVIGMRESVLDRAGILFARMLCDELVRQERVDVALQKARAAITRPLEGEFRETAKSTVVMDSAQLAELSLGQWCLPALQTATPEHPLITWDFQPQPHQANLTHDHLNNISLPARFIGRRFDLREATRHLMQHHQLLITGPGGQGKTALAGKLAQDFQRRGYAILAWTAHAENTWDGFVLSLLEQLTDQRKERYDKALYEEQTETEKATLLLSLLLEQTGGKLILFFDNLESIQNPDTRALTDETVAAWIQAAQSLTEKETSLLLTSRWLLPDWSERDHKTLVRMNYGDFLIMARQVNLPRRFLYRRDRLRQVYYTLNGNGRGLHFFAGAMVRMETEEETAFLESLSQARAETQTDMALDAIIARLTPDELNLLARLRVYPVPVPLGGIVKIALGLPDGETLLNSLLAVSLVERHYESYWRVFQYYLPTIVMDWLVAHAARLVTDVIAGLAAVYQLYLYNNERRTLIQAQIVHDALRRAKMTHEADLLALNQIVGPLNRAGLYRTLITDWLPAICNSPVPAVRLQGLTQAGKQYLHLGNFAKALPYFDTSLALSREIGDKTGEDAILNNLSIIFKKLGDYKTSLDYLQRALLICREIGNKAGEGTVLNNISQIYNMWGDYELALDNLQQSLVIRQEAKDKAGEGSTLNNMATIFLAQGDFETASAYLQRSLSISREIGDKALEGTALENIANIAYERGDYQTALLYQQRVLALRQEFGDKAGEGMALNNLAQSFQALGNYQTALVHLHYALTLRQEIGDKAGEGMALNNLANIYDVRGDYETAKVYAERGLAIRQEIGDKAGEGMALDKLAQIIWAQGDHELALTYWLRSLTIQQGIGDKVGEGRTLNNLAQVYRAQGKIETALNYALRALKRQQDIEDKTGESSTRNNLALIFKEKGDYNQALAHLQHALKIEQNNGNKAGEGRTLNNMMSIAYSQGDYETAMTYVKRALEISNEVGDSANLQATLFNIGHLYAQNGKIQDAIVTWVTVYRHAKKNNNAEALEALSDLATNLGLPDGLEGWNILARRIGAEG